jgi:pilus assembly protein TadC
MLFPLDEKKKRSHRLRGLGKLSKILSPTLDNDLIRAEMDVNADDYRVASALSALIFAIIMFVFIFVILLSFTQDFRMSLYLGLGAACVPFFMIYLILLRYPKIVSGKESEQVDKDLVYALKDMLLSISSGLSIFTAINLVSKGSYGYVSKDFKRIVTRVNTGVPLEEALEDLAITTPSEHFQGAIWQIINTSKSGADVEGVLRSLVENLVAEQRSTIQKYSHELNVLTLMYMLAAVAVPTIITTLMIILNTFVSTGINELMFVIFMMMSLFVQFAIVGLVKSRRPVVHV